MVEAAQAPLDDGEQAQGDQTSAEPRQRWPTLEPEARYGLTGDVLDAIEPHTEADPAALALQWLTFFGAAVGRQPHWCVEADKHYGNLYVLLVGPTSRARKGTSFGWIRRLFAAADPEFCRHAIVGGLTSGEGLVAHLARAGESGEPPAKDYRLLIYEPEFARVLATIRRDGNTLSAILREAWDVGELQVLNKNSPLRAEQSHVSLVAHTTRDELLRLLTEIDAANGFGNRFLVAMVRRSKCLPDGGRLEEATLAPLVGRLRTVLERARRIGRLGRTEAARELWHTVYPVLTADRPGLAGAMTARAEAQVTRLSLVYALLDGADRIDVPHLRAALMGWAFCEQSIELIFGERLGDPTADAVVTHLQAAGGALSRTELSAALGRNVSAAEIERALTVLLAAKQVTIRRVARERGRPKEVVYLRRYEKNEKNSLALKIKELCGRTQGIIS
ncbi:DUF3987 domain-containing protein [Nitrospira sp. Kam-Ns4a]